MEGDRRNLCQGVDVLIEENMRGIPALRDIRNLACEISALQEIRIAQ